MDVKVMVTIMMITMIRLYVSPNFDEYISMYMLEINNLLYWLDGFSNSLEYEFNF